MNPPENQPLRAGPLHEEITDADRAVIAAELAAMERAEPPPPPDPWAHRRGEPRVFAFFWTMYVLLAVAGSVSWVARFAPVTAGSYGPAARIMLVVVAVGATILWPMTRLSQSSPGRGAPRSALADALVILIPMQMIVWPLIFLANWPAATVAAVSALAICWVGLIAGMLAMALGERIEAPGHPALLARSLWMLTIVILVLAAPLSMLGWRPRLDGLGGPPAWLPMLSPLSAISDLTGRGMSGPQNPVSAAQWRLIAATGITAAGVWAIALSKSRFARHAPDA